MWNTGLFAESTRTPLIRSCASNVITVLCMRAPPLLLLGSRRHRRTRSKRHSSCSSSKVGRPLRRRRGTSFTSLLLSEVHLPLVLARRRDRQNFSLEPCEPARSPHAPPQ